MAQSNIFQWRQGTGWLIFSSGTFTNGETEAVDWRMLNRCDADGALVYIDAAGDAITAERYLNYLSDMGGRAGYTVDIIGEDDHTLRQQIGDAGIVVIGDGPQADKLYNGLHGAAIEAIQTAYEHGAVIMGCGLGAEIFGQWFLPPSTRQALPGFEWLTRSIILTTQPGGPTRQTLKNLLRAQPTLYGLGIRPGSALVLGPENQVELWGKQQISISLGQAYSVQTE